MLPNPLTRSNPPAAPRSNPPAAPRSIPHQHPPPAARRTLLCSSSSCCRKERLRCRVTYASYSSASSRSSCSSGRTRGAGGGREARWGRCGREQQQQRGGRGREAGFTRAAACERSTAATRVRLRRATGQGPHLLVLVHKGGPHGREGLQPLLRARQLLLLLGQLPLQRLLVLHQVRQLALQAADVVLQGVRSSERERVCFTKGVCAWQCLEPAESWGAEGVTRRCNCRLTTAVEQQRNFACLAARLPVS